MKIKNYLLLCAVIVSVFFTSCNNNSTTTTGTGEKASIKTAGPLTSSAGSSLQDTVLPKLLVKFVHIGPGNAKNYLAYYWCNSLKVDSTTNPPTLTLAAQSAYYDSVNTSSIVHNGSTTSQVSSTVSVNTDTVTATYAGPFDPVNGQIYTYKGYLYYYSKTSGTTQICPVGSLVYVNQSGSGAPIGIGFASTQDLH